MASTAAAKEGGKEKFLVLPILVLILAQMGTSGDNGALSLAATALTTDLGATVADIQLANMVYSLMAGAFMIAGGMMGTIIGWKKNFRMGALMCAAGEVVLAMAPNMAVFIWGGRTLVGFGASFMIPSVLGLVPKIYHGKNRVLAFGCIGAASGLSALLPLLLSIVLMSFGMRVTFFVLAAYFAIVFLLSFKLPEIEQNDGKLKFDGIGVALAALGLFLFLVGVSRISAWGLIEPFAAMAFSVTLDSASLPGIVVGCILAGSGAGIVSAQANNVVALAVNERDAAQSGGIQTTMRNVGQAIGIALLGAVLLFGITNNVIDGAKNDDRISEATVEAISERNIDLTSDDAFRASIEDIEMSDSERDALVEVNAEARFNSTRFAYGVGAVIILLGLLTTPAIKIFKKEEA